MKPSLAASFSFLFFYIFKFYTPNPPQPLKKNLPFKPSTNFKTFFNLPNPLICIPTLLSLSNPPVNNLTLLPPSKLCCNFATLRSPFQHFYLLLYLHVVFQTHFQPSNPSCHIPHRPIKFTKIMSPSHLLVIFPILLSPNCLQHSQPSYYLLTTSVLFGTLQSPPKLLYTMSSLPVTFPTLLSPSQNLNHLLKTSCNLSEHPVLIKTLVSPS